MLDLRFIRENPELVEKASCDKHFPIDIKTLLAWDEKLKKTLSESENLQARRNSLSRKIPKVSETERQSLKAEVLELKKNLDSLQEKAKEAKKNLQELLLKVAQPAYADVPIGKDDRENIEIKKWGDIKPAEETPLDHLSLGEKLGIIDIARGVKLAGSRSYILKADGALLEQALIRFAYDELAKAGLIPMSVPVLVNEKTMEGTGYFPLGREQAYCIEKDKLALVGTSEVSLCGMHAGDIFQEKELPLRYMAISTCFRREAGTYGKDTKGLYRVHQFQKIEMLTFGKAEQEESEKLHQELLTRAEDLLQKLELPYRVVYVCTGDLGQGQVRKHDIETWMPSRNSYGETNSCSSFWDFQARRLGIKYKTKEGKKNFVHTLNNTALATPRIILALLENYQTKDGRVEIPKVLRPYMGNRKYLAG